MGWFPFGSAPAAYTLAPSGDTTGVIDTGRLVAVVAAVGAAGTVNLTEGAFYWKPTTIPHAGITFQGAGRWATIVYTVGTGDTIRMYQPTSYQPGNVAGGGFLGMTFDGANAGAGSSGFHVGDIYNLEFDVGVRNYQGSGSVGAWLDNQYYWTEQTTGKIWVEQCTTGVLFDNSANLSGSATGSFDRTFLELLFDQKGKGNLVVFQNGTFILDGQLGIYGNTDYGASTYYVLTLTGPPGFSFTATNASPCVFTAAGSYYSNGMLVTLAGGSLPTGFTAGTAYYVVNASGATFQLAATSGGTAINSTSTGSGTVTGLAYSGLANSVLNIGVECNGTTGTQPGTINFGTSQLNQISRCTGIIDFTSNNPFAAANNWTESFQFDGPVLGDSKLARVTGAGQTAFVTGVLTTGGFLTARWNSLITAAPAGNVTGIIMSSGTNTGSGSTADWGNYFCTVVNIGAGSITFAAQGTSNVAGGAAVSIAAGTGKTFEWIPVQGLWYPVQ